MRCEKNELIVQVKPNIRTFHPVWAPPVQFFLCVGYVVPQLEAHGVASETLYER